MDAIENKIEGEAAQEMMGGGNQQQGGSNTATSGMEDQMINSGTFPLFSFELSVASLREQRVINLMK